MSTAHYAVLKAEKKRVCLSISDSVRRDSAHRIYQCRTRHPRPDFALLFGHRTDHPAGPADHQSAGHLVDQPVRHVLVTDGQILVVLSAHVSLCIIVLHSVICHAIYSSHMLDGF